MNLNNYAIGVFDSGLGGLTVIKAIQDLLPNENLIYFGDTARVPYGNKSKESIIRYSEEIIDFFIQQNVKVIVVACNTASSYALETIQKRTSIPILGVIEPGANALIKHYPHIKKAGVIATRATINSQAYQTLIQNKMPHLTLVSKPCPLFVPLIEEGFLNGNITECVVKEYIEYIYNQDVRHLILGCTHYPLLKEAIQKIYPHLILIDSSVEIAYYLKEIIEQKNIVNTNQTKGSLEIYASDVTESLKELKTLFLNNNTSNIIKVNLNW